MNRKAVIGVKFHQKSPELEEQKEKQKKKNVESNMKIHIATCV